MSRKARDDFVTRLPVDVEREGYGKGKDIFIA